jgi:hypothetical protein
LTSSSSPSSSSSFVSQTSQYPAHFSVGSLIQVRMAKGAATFSITTLSITELILAFSTKDAEHVDTWYKN